MKRTLKMALIASLAVGGSYVLYGSQNKEELSDLALSNVEALTLGLSSTYKCNFLGADNKQ